MKKWALLAAAFELINRLLDALEEWMRRRAQEKREQSNAKLNDDPAGWFADHFGGVRDDKADAPKADPAKPESDPK